MIKPQPGDMFRIPVPFRDDFFQSKLRPVVVLKDLGNGMFLVAPVTGTNLTGLQSGLWISKNSPEGKSMNLTKDSFIIVDAKYKWPSYALIDYWGRCNLVEELLSKLK